MELMQAIKERRSIRKYKTDPIREEVINSILEAARWAPSWANSQCWRIVIVRDAEIREKLAGSLLSMSPGKENRAASAFRSAPVVIVACAQLKTSGYYKGEQATDKGDWYMFDVALAMHNMTLAAHSLGLGTVHIGLFDAKEAARILDAPDDVAVVEMLPLGYPDEEPTAPNRKEIADFTFQDIYGEKL